MNRIARKTAALALAVAAALFALPAGAIEPGWTAGPMAADGSTIRTEGELVYAYSSPGGTVGGVEFTKAYNFSDASMVSASPAAVAGNSGGGFLDDGATGDFGSMLRDGWYWTGDGTELSYTLTLTGLKTGSTYLVQLVAHRQSNAMLVSANGSTPVNIHGNDEAHYKYGASIVGVFVAEGPTEDVTVTYTMRGDQRPLNAIQVRELPSDEPAGKPAVITVR